MQNENIRLNNKNILFVTESIPVPVRNGRELPIYQSALSLGSEYNVDLMVVSRYKDEFYKRKDSDEARRIFRNIFFLEGGRDSGLLSTMKDLLLIKPSFYTDCFDVATARKIFSENRYDTIWVSPVGCIAVWQRATENGLKVSSKVVIGVNDVKFESNIDNFREMLSGQKLNISRYKQMVRLLHMYVYERRFMRIADVIHLQTKKEKAVACKYYGKTVCQKVIVAQNSIKKELVGLESTFRSSGRNILLMTHLDGGREFEISWFIRKVWPKVLSKCDGAQLKVVGSPPKKDSWIFSEDLRNIELLGFVDDLSELYSQIDITVVPITHGTGIINRVVDAFAAGVPVVARREPLGTVDGFIADVHALSADNPSDFADAVVRLLNDVKQRETLAQNARGLIADARTIETVLPELL